MNDYVIGLGEALWDVLPEGKKLGGAPANFAYHVSQFGLNGLAVSAIGKDALGDETLRAFDDKKLRYKMDRVDFPTGTVQVSLDAEGVPQYEIKEGVAWDNIPYTPALEALSRDCKAVCFGSLAQRSAVSRATIGRFLDLVPQDVLKIFDINLRQNFYSKELLEASFRHCNVLKINDEELIIVGRLFGYEGLSLEDKCRQLLKNYQLRMLILTCGVNGSYVFAPNGEAGMITSFYETPKVKVADTVGAGDSFTGAFVACILRGMPVQEAHRRAVDVSAFVCTQPGAMPTIPAELIR